ncbi:MAG: hypothetical protein ACFBRM_11455 [Pikeienuella sp.]
MTLKAHRFEIDPSGRPLKGAGLEAVISLGLVCIWVVLIAAVFAAMGRDASDDVGWPMFSLMAVFCFCWLGAEITAGRHQLIWPASAFGVLGPLSLGFAFALATPELRTGPHLSRVAIVAATGSLGMIPFLVRFRLPGLVSPIITFMLVGIFLSLYGTDMGKIRQLEGFSPRGIAAALMNDWRAAALFGLLAAVATVVARRLDLSGDNFGLAAARPLHLVGGGVLALVLGRAFALLPQPLDLALLGVAWLVALAWALRVNRIAVLFATHFAMAKPMIVAVITLFGVTLDFWDWVWVLFGILVVDMLIWLPLHRYARDIDWTLGPGGIKPPRDRRELLRFWRYWPYATDESLNRWADERRTRREEKARKRADRAARRAERQARRAERTRAGGKRLSGSG